MKKDATRVAILDAASRLLARGGLASATMDAIAAEAGMTKGGVFYYFSNKRELFAASLHHFVASLHGRYQAALSTLPPHRSTNLRAMIAALQEYIDNLAESHSGLGVLGDPAYRGILAKAKRDIFRLVRDPGRPDAVTAILLLILDGVWVSRMFQPRPESEELENAARECYRDLVDGDWDHAGPFPAGGSFAAGTLPSRAVGAAWPTESADTRNALLDAAEHVLANQGLIGLTLGAVASEAGSSKGGLLHYFGNKRELLNGVIDRLEERFFQRRDAIYAGLPETPSRLSRATLLTIIQSRRRNRGTALYRVDMLDDPHFRERLRQIKARTHADILAGVRHPEKVLLALYLLDGLWLNELFKPNPIPVAVVRQCWQWLHLTLADMDET